MGSDVITTLSNNRWILFENKIIASDLDVGSPYGMCNELSLGLKLLDLPVQCSRLLLTRGEIELCKSFSSRQVPANAPRPSSS